MSNSGKKSKLTDAQKTSIKTVAKTLSPAPDDSKVEMIINIMEMSDKDWTTTTTDDALKPYVEAYNASAGPLINYYKKLKIGLGVGGAVVGLSAIGYFLYSRNAAKTRR